MKILVTGGEGNLATALKKVLPDAWYPSKTELDVTKPDKEVINQYDVVINAAAMTDVDKCEVDDNSLIVNAVAPAMMFNEFKGKLFIQISSASVFGSFGVLQPDINFLERAPLSQYSEAKRMVEDSLVSKFYYPPNDSKLLIIRTGWLFGGERDRKFMYQVTKKLRNKEGVSAVNDIEGQIMHVDDLAKFIKHCIDHYQERKRDELPYVHAVSYNKCTRYDLANYINRKLYPPLPQGGGIFIYPDSPNITPVSNHDFNTIAPRPPHELLSVQKTERIWDWKFRSWEQMVDDYLKE